MLQAILVVSRKSAPSFQQEIPQAEYNVQSGLSVCEGEEEEIWVIDR